MEERTSVKTTSLKLRADVHHAVKRFCFERNLNMYEVQEQSLVDFLEKMKVDPKLIPKVNIYDVNNGVHMCQVMTCPKRHELIQWKKVQKNPNTDQDVVIGTKAVYCELHSIGLPERGWEIAAK